MSRDLPGDAIFEGKTAVFTIESFIRECHFTNKYLFLFVMQIMKRQSEID